MRKLLKLAGLLAGIAAIFFLTGLTYNFMVGFAIGSVCPECVGAGYVEYEQWIENGKDSWSEWITEACYSCATEGYIVAGKAWWLIGIGLFYFVPTLIVTFGLYPDEIVIFGVKVSLAKWTGKVKDTLRIEKK